MFLHVVGIFTLGISAPERMNLFLPSLSGVTYDFSVVWKCDLSILGFSTVFIIETDVFFGTTFVWAELLIHDSEGV